MAFRFWPEDATKPGPMRCGLDWTVVAAVVVLYILVAYSQRPLP